MPGFSDHLSSPAAAVRLGYAIFDFRAALLLRRIFSAVYLSVPDCADRYLHVSGLPTDTPSPCHRDAVDADKLQRGTYL